MTRLHVFGASGSGTTTLSKVLSTKLCIPHFDSDNYYWKNTVVPFTEKNSIDERHALLLRDLEGLHDWIISGSMTSWARPFVPRFQLAIYLYVPKDIRVERLKSREFQRYGARILPNGDMHELHREFIDWAAQYDEGIMTGRSKPRHNEWMATLSCPILKIEGNLQLDAIVEQVTAELQKLGLK